MGRITRNSLDELWAALYTVWEFTTDLDSLRIELRSNHESRRATAAVLAISKKADDAIAQWSIIKEMCLYMETKDV